MFASTAKAAAKVAVSLCLIWLLISCSTAPTPLPTEPTIAPAPTDEVIVLTLAPAPTDEPTPSETALPPDESVLTPFEDEVWSGSYDEFPSELCPTEPNASEGAIKESITRPVFEDAPHQEESTWVQRGLYANKQGEVFALVVTGFGNSGEYVKEYADSIQMCLDRLITTSAPNTDQPLGTLPEGTIEQPEEEDLLIMFEFVGGSFGGDSGWLKEKVSDVSQFRALPKHDEGDMFTSALTLFDKDPRASVIDLIYDPPIRSRATHVYLDHGTVKSKTTDVRISSGNVKAKRCTHPSLGIRGIKPTSVYRVRGRVWYDYAYAPGKWLGGCDPW